MGELSVRHTGGDRFRIEVRGHTLVVDQPRADGGEDSAATPTELFVAALGSCVAHYARRYLARHDLPSTGLSVRVEYATASRPGRVSGIRVVIVPPPGLPPERRDPLLAVASHCTVHNSLRQPPEVSVELAGTLADAHPAGPAARTAAAAG